MSQKEIIINGDIFKQIKGYKGIYVSQKGQVFSEKSDAFRNFKGNNLSLTNSNGKSVKVNLARVVAACFLPKMKKGQVLYRKNIKAGNVAENLFYDKPGSHPNQIKDSFYSEIVGVKLSSGEKFYSMNEAARFLKHNPSIIFNKIKEIKHPVTGKVIKISRNAEVIKLSSGEKFLSLKEASNFLNVTSSALGCKFKEILHPVTNKKVELKRVK